MWPVYGCSGVGKDPLATKAGGWGASLPEDLMLVRRGHSDLLARRASFPPLVEVD